MSKSTVIPFGKYKGQPIEALTADPQYCEWLLAQDWFRSRYQPIYTIVVNNFGEPAETPEHNQMQALFTDVDYCKRFILRACTRPLLARFTELKDEKLGFEAFDLKRLETQRETLKETWWREHQPDRYDKEVKGAEAHIAQIKATIEKLQKTAVADFNVSATFEVHGADVLLEYRFLFHCNRLEADGYIYVECKPSLGDDYPAVLRQIITISSQFGRHPLMCLLFVGDGGYTGTGASFEAVRTMFLSRGVHIALQRDLNQPET